MIAVAPSAPKDNYATKKRSAPNGDGRDVIATQKRAKDVKVVPNKAESTFTLPSPVAEDASVGIAKVAKLAATSDQAEKMVDGEEAAVSEEGKIKEVDELAIIAGQGEATGIGGEQIAAEEGETKKKKIKLKKRVAERIRALNADGALSAPLRIGAVAAPLALLGEEDALSVLDTLSVPADEGGGEGVDDPTAWIVAAAEGAAEQAGAEDEQWGAWEDKEAQRAGELLESLSTAVVERIRSINRTVNLAEPLRLAQVAGPLTAAGEVQALKLLDELVDRAEELETPSSWLRSNAYRKAGNVMRRVDELNRGTPGQMDLLARMSLDQVRGPLLMIEEKYALKILQKLGDNPEDIEDPTAWVVKAAKAKVSPLGKQLQDLNDLGTLLEPIRIPECLEALRPLDPQAAARLINAMRRRKDIRTPTAFIICTAANMVAKLAAEAGSEVALPWKAPGAKRHAEAPDDAEMGKTRRKGNGKGKESDGADSKGKKGVGKGKGNKGVGKDEGNRTARLGPMADAAPATPPWEADGKEVSPKVQKKAGADAVESADDGSAEGLEAEAMLDPVAAKEAEAAAWRELREAFGEEPADEEWPEDEWPEEDVVEAVDAKPPKKAKTIEAIATVQARDDIGGECDDGEVDGGECDDGECDDDDIQ